MMTSRTRNGVVAATLIASVALTGCGFLKRKQSAFYSVDRIPPAAGATALGGTPIGIDVVELPPGLDRRDIVVRLADQRLTVRETDQWSAQLEPLVLHTLAFNLAARVPEGMLILPGQPIPNGAKRGIDVVFEELAAGPENRFVLDARWNLRETGRPVFTQHERIEVPLASLESGEIAIGMSRALGELSDRMVAGLTARR